MAGLLVATVVGLSVAYWATHNWRSRVAPVYFSYGPVEILRDESFRLVGVNHGTGECSVRLDFVDEDNQSLAWDEMVLRSGTSDWIEVTAVDVRTGDDSPNRPPEIRGIGNASGAPEACFPSFAVEAIETATRKVRWRSGEAVFDDLR